MAGRQLAGVGASGEAPWGQGLAGGIRPGGRLVAKAQVMSSDDVSRALTRIAHEIVERDHGDPGLALIGLQAGGVPLARRLASILEGIQGSPVHLGSLDVAFYRDDIALRRVLPEAVTEIDFDLTGLLVVLVDDVLFTGRTVRAAMSALADYGRPRAVRLAVMVDRGHRELPIRPDYVGKNLPTRRDELVEVAEGGVRLLGTAQG